jgi:hypothetical protein
MVSLLTLVMYPDQNLFNSYDETKFQEFTSGSITHFGEFLTCFTHCNLLKYQSN